MQTSRILRCTGCRRLLFSTPRGFYPNLLIRTHIPETKLELAHNFQRRFYKIPRVEFTHTEVHHPLDNHIQSCLDDGAELQASNFSACFLGSGGSQPSKHRMTSSTLLRFGGLSFMFDAGEGVQRQLQYSRISFSTISKICITHMHGDHVFGLPGLLLELLLAQAKRPVPDPIDIYGPNGFFNFIASSMTFSKASFQGTQITIHELIGGDADTGTENTKH